MKFVLAFATDSDTLIRTAYWTGISALVVTVLMLATVVFLRMAWINQQRRRRKIVRKWRPFLSLAKDGEQPEKLPMLLRPDRLYFLEYWNYLSESANEVGKEGLSTLAKRLKMDAVASKLADSKYLWRQLLGLQTLGHLKDPASTEKLRQYVHSGDNVVSMTAARALMQTNPDLALPEITPFIRSRDDWAETRIAELLHNSDPKRSGVALISLLDGATPRQQTRIIRLIGSTNSAEGLQAVRDRLMSYQNERDNREYDPAIIAGLGILNNPSDRPLIRNFLTHPDWHVREEAANALGRVAGPEDEQPLLALLRDDHWWVRYRAAQAMAQIPNLSLEDLRLRTEHEENPAAQEILRHVLAEQRFAN